MDEKLIICLLFAFLLVFPLIHSVQPSVSVPTATTGIVIEHPLKDVIQANQTHKFHFHLYNQTDGTPFLNTTSTIKCVFHLYDLDGNHILKVNNVSSDDTYDWEQLVLGGNFTKIGQYSYVFQCNNTIVGGFYEHDFLVAYTDKELTVAQAILYGSLFIVLILLLIAIPFLTTFLPSSDTKDEEGRLMQISWLKYFRPILWFTEWMMAIALFYISSNLAFAYLNETLFATILLTIFRIMFGVTPLIVIVWMVWFFVHFFQDKQFQNMINRGIFPQGKL